MKDLNKFNQNETFLLSKSFIYVASPYTHTDIEVIRERLRLTRKATRNLMQTHRHHAIFSPVLYTTELQKADMTPDEGWYQFCLGFLAKADRMIVLKLDGWENSVGIGLEIAFAQAKEIPIAYCSLENIEKDEVNIPF